MPIVAYPSANVNTRFFLKITAPITPSEATIIFAVCFAKIIQFINTKRFAKEKRTAKFVQLCDAF